jgi:hypothetical protein
MDDLLKAAIIAVLFAVPTALLLLAVYVRAQSGRSLFSTVRQKKRRRAREYREYCARREVYRENKRRRDEEKMWSDEFLLEVTGRNARPTLH